MMPAQQAWIHVQLQHRFEAETLAYRLGNAILVLVRQIDGGIDVHAQPVGAFVAQIMQGAANRADQIEAVVIVQDQQEIPEDAAGPAL